MTRPLVIRQMMSLLSFLVLCRSRLISQELYRLVWDMLMLARSRLVMAKAMLGTRLCTPLKGS